VILLGGEVNSSKTEGNISNLINLDNSEKNKGNKFDFIKKKAKDNLNNEKPLKNELPPLISQNPTGSMLFKPEQEDNVKDTSKFSFIKSIKSKTLDQKSK